MHYLKNYFLLSLLSIGLLISCDEDSSNETTAVTVTEENLVGEWNMTGFVTENGKTVTRASGQTITVDYTQVGSDFSYDAIFSSNPNTISGEGTYTVVTTSTTTFLGQSQTDTQTTFIDSDDFDANLLSGTWELVENGTVIRTTTPSGSSSAKIIKFSEDELVYSLDLSEGTVVSPSEDVSIEVTGTSIVTLNR